MKKFSAIFILNVFMLSAASAQTPAEPTLTAKSWLLLDTNSDHVLASHDPDVRVEPASLVKLMTGYLACAAIQEKSSTCIKWSTSRPAPGRSITKDRACSFNLTSR